MNLTQQQTGREGENGAGARAQAPDNYPRFNFGSGYERDRDRLERARNLRDATQTNPFSRATNRRERLDLFIPPASDDSMDEF